MKTTLSKKSIKRKQITNSSRLGAATPSLPPAVVFKEGPNADLEGDNAIDEPPNMYTVESLKRKQDYAMEIFRKKGYFSDAEVDEVLLKVLDSRRSYLLKRLGAILQNRSREEAEAIRNQYKVMAEAEEAEKQATLAEKHETQQRNFDKMLRFLENYSRVQESQNLKRQEQI